jgi:hypothetical protein
MQMDDTGRGRQAVFEIRQGRVSDSAAYQQDVLDIQEGESISQRADQPDTFAGLERAESLATLPHFLDHESYPALSHLIYADGFVKPVSLVAPVRLEFKEHSGNAAGSQFVILYPQDPVAGLGSIRASYRQGFLANAQIASQVILPSNMV